MFSVIDVAQMQSLPPNVAGGVVYQPGAPPSYPGTFSPAGSVEGSPMHNIYMNQPGQTAPAQYQAMPGPATGEEDNQREIDNLWPLHYPNKYASVSLIVFGLCLSRSQYG